MRRSAFMSRCHVPLRLLGAIGLLALAAAGPDPARAPHDPSLELVVANRSRQAIIQLYVSPSASEEWGDDRVAESSLPAGKSIRVRLRRPPDCRIDLQVVYDDESSEERHGFDACASRQISFDGTNAASPTTLFSRAHEVTLTNGSSRPIQQVYVSASEADQWGDDRLGQSSLSVGDSRAIGYRGPCAADLRVVFDNGAAEERRALDLCAMPALIIEPGWTTSDRPRVPANAEAPVGGGAAAGIAKSARRGT
jgi:hypothetical protein